VFHEAHAERYRRLNDVALAYELTAAANPATDLWVPAACQHAWAFNAYPGSTERVFSNFSTQIPAVVAPFAPSRTAC
jgi:hypothetical protein